VSAFNDSYSSEEIRFNLLAIAERSLPLLTSRLTELQGLYSTFLSHLDTNRPDWRASLDPTPALQGRVDTGLVNKTIEEGDLLESISLKKALDRDISAIKSRITDEEEKLSKYAVCARVLLC
jgi:hypothetical protein